MSKTNTINVEINKGLINHKWCPIYNILKDP